MTERSALIIHGHFYQPPREDPWTEEIEGEPSAAPFGNWNERIHHECYRPNAHSRILGEFARVREIGNNYTGLSFNFGPTLLSWMERFDPETHGAIIEADKLSRERNHGHGNAIAQAYNHIIMPLADERDRETQALWGLADFRHRFGREADAMWMPETAVDLDTLGLLARLGMKFAILSPHQAAQIQNEKGEWLEASGGKFDTSRPYLVETASGNLPVFFYHGAVSSEISFSHLLRSGDKFMARLADAARGLPLLSVATDGEIYGHHEPFGDMCLAYALDWLRKDDSDFAKRFYTTNFSAYLEANPARLFAKIATGGSSWSCAHGVERWRADCGCRTGQDPAVNQKWRAPLREALDALRDSLKDVYLKSGEAVFTDPHAARNAYIDVILRRYSEEAKHDFAARWIRGGADAPTAWQLLESQRNAQLMFTSCGWFFDDLAGIEPRQVLLYAGRAIDAVRTLVSPHIEAAFLKKLSEAMSNALGEGTGAEIYGRDVKLRRAARLRVLNHEVLSSSSSLKPHVSEKYVVSFEAEAFWEAEDESLGRGVAAIRDIRTERTDRYGWAARFRPSAPETLFFEIGGAVRWPGGDPRGRSWAEIRPAIGKRKGVTRMGLRDLFRSESQMLMQSEFRKAEREIEAQLRAALSKLDETVTRALEVNARPEPAMMRLLASMAEFLWASHVRNANYDAARRLQIRCERWQLAIPKEGISAEISHQLDTLARKIRKAGRDSREFDTMLAVLRSVQPLGLVVDARLAQETIFELIRGEGRRMIEKIVSERREDLYDSLSGMLEAAERLNVELTEERKAIESFEAGLSDDPRNWP